MEMFLIMLNIGVLIKAVSSAVMCVYGYKWEKGLIATVSIDIGLALGLMFSIFFIKSGAGVWALFITPIVAIIFSVLAYKSIMLNHFVAGFLLTVKVTFMLMLVMADNGVMDLDAMSIYIVPIIIGLLSGTIVCVKYNRSILLLCVSFIGATEFVPAVFSLMNKGLFFATQDFGYIFDPEEFLLGLFGIEIPSVIEAMLIMAVFAGSFLFQRKKLMQLGSYDRMANRIVDDRRDNKENIKDIWK